MLDAGANKGAFGAAIVAVFPVSVVSIEPNPALCASLETRGAVVHECALGAKDGVTQFNVGYNDEASSIRTPEPGNAHLRIRQTVQVRMKSLPTIMLEEKIPCFACVKLDIEGAEVDVLMSLSSQAAPISPQWTVEFHDGREFRLCTHAEVNDAMAAMKRSGFSILLRDWPARTNVLFVDRNALSISLLEWAILKIRYQYLAVLWRMQLALRNWPFRAAEAVSSDNKK